MYNSSKIIALSIIIFLVGCGTNRKKVYDSFELNDNIKITEKSWDTSPKAGGPGFEKIASKLGWETNENFISYADPKAIKGDTITIVGGDVFPPTFRGFGVETRTQLNGLLESLVYEPLIGFSSETFEYQPSLATHWKIGSDSLTYFFRIDPRARWANGKEVTAQDVVETFRLIMDEGHKDPNVYTFWQERINLPVQESKYIVRIDAKKKEWRLLLNIGGTYIYPAYHIEKIDGISFIEKYQFEMMPGTGPYELDHALTTQGNNGIIALKRRTNYWAIDFEQNQGYNNFDCIKFIFINDETQMVERFFAGDYDIYAVGRAQWWKEKFTAEQYSEIADGYIQRKKFINYNPKGVSGIAFNTLEPPFNDIKVREAFTYLWDVDKLIDKLFFNEYVRTNSWYPRSQYEHPDNPKQYYNPDKALELLTEAGWTKKPGEQWLSKDTMKMIFDFNIYQGWDRIFNYFVQDVEAIGVKLNLNVMQNPFEILMKRKYKLQRAGWTGSLLPSPEGMLHSKYSKKLEVTNVTGMANPKIDELIEKYNNNWDSKKRINLLKQIDSIASKEYHWIFGWDAPYGFRCLHWNKFVIPDDGIGYSGNWTTPLSLWWSDPKQKEKFNLAIKKNESLPIEAEVLEYKLK